MNGPNQNLDEEYEGISEINVVPLVDVFLVLLVIFMITAPVIKTALEMGLPEAESAQTDPSPGLTIEVLRDGTLWIDQERVHFETFRTSFRTRWADLDEEGRQKPVFIAADTTVNYGNVIFVLDELQLAGVENVGFLARQESTRRRR